MKTKNVGRWVFFGWTMVLWNTHRKKYRHTSSEFNFFPSRWSLLLFHLCIVYVAFGHFPTWLLSNSILFYTFSCFPSLSLLLSPSIPFYLLLFVSLVHFSKINYHNKREREFESEWEIIRFPMNKLRLHEYKEQFSTLCES